MLFAAYARNVILDLFTKDQRCSVLNISTGMCISSLETFLRKHSLSRMHQPANLFHHLPFLA